ncbi:hypothetical protein [Anabaena lutea]|uniref:hypothetical protein n=1 Tax=Anabaena lutea TaxID=212350 RepID=UPI00168904CE|nr:hypothetical protein [Anabaena lutea]
MANATATIPYRLASNEYQSVMDVSLNASINCYGALLRKKIAGRMLTAQDRIIYSTSRCYEVQEPHPRKRGGG